jgi:tricin synthase
MLLSNLNRRFSITIRDNNHRLSEDKRVEECQFAIANGITILCCLI